jgi:glucan biosynthesis protein C
MRERASFWARIAVWVHLVVVGLASWQLACAHTRPVIALWAALSAVSLFVLTGLVHEASHRLLCRSAWVNELAGNLAGWVVLTPLTAYRAFHLKHHQTTNREDDPNAPLNSRWMLGVGSLVYVVLIHWYALKNLRGRALGLYLMEVAGMIAFLGSLILLPRAFRERSWLLPLGIVTLLQNIRIVTEHLDLPSGRYRDTWQLALPRWLSGWLLHYDHHLEHHLRPGLHWHELPAFRVGLIGRQEVAANRVTLGQFFSEVFADRGARRARTPEHDGTEVHSTRVGPASRAGLRVDRSEVKIDPSGARYHGLDALRAATMVWVVVLHAGLAYTKVPILNLIWAVRDPSAHWAFDVICWWALGISSPFFLMSGFFAADLYCSRGVRTFAVNRAKRILGPFLAAGMIVLPATYFVWVAGWLISERCTPREFLRMKYHERALQRNLFGPAHLWSLEYLLVLLGTFWIVLELRKAVPWRSTRLSLWADGLGERLTSGYRVLLLAAPTTLILWAGHRHVGLDAIMDRQNSFVPDTYRLLHNAVFFAVGVILYRSRHLLGRLAAHSWVYLALALPVFAARGWLIDRDLSTPLVGPAGLALAATGALFTWLITFGFLGLALGAFNRPRPTVRYLADSSYWIYLCHLPIVGLMQVDLYGVQAPAVVKFALVLAVSLGLGLASYQGLVRYTLLGFWLHGRRERPGLTSPFPRKGPHLNPRAHSTRRAIHNVG